MQIERNVQMVVPACDFCVPNKKCTSATDDPCDLFSKIEFPTEEFFPPRMQPSENQASNSLNSGCCGSGSSQEQ